MHVSISSDDYVINTYRAELYSDPISWQKLYCDNAIGIKCNCQYGSTVQSSFLHTNSLIPWIFKDLAGVCLTESPTLILALITVMCTNYFCFLGHDNVIHCLLFSYAMCDMANVFSVRRLQYCFVAGIICTADIIVTVVRDVCLVWRGLNMPVTAGDARQLTRSLDSTALYQRLHMSSDTSRNWTTHLSYSGSRHSYFILGRVRVGATWVAYTCTNYRPGLVMI